MRDPKRIPVIIELIRDIWIKCPDLRLFQLLINATKSSANLYQVEDDDLRAALEKDLLELQSHDRQYLYGSKKIEPKKQSDASMAAIWNGGKYHDRPVEDLEKLRNHMEDDLKYSNPLQRRILHSYINDIDKLIQKKQFDSDLNAGNMSI